VDAQQDWQDIVSSAPHRWKQHYPGGNMDILELLTGFCRSWRLGRQLFLLGVISIASASLASSASAHLHVDSQGRWPECDGRSANQPVSFVHVSDIHANYNPDTEGSSPVSRVRGYYEMVKRENSYTVFTNAGDDYEKGSITEEVSRGRSTREVVQALGFDVRTIGNHDFAWGLQELLQFSSDPRAMVLSTNARVRGKGGDLPHGMSPGWKDFGILEVGCVRIGFFGMTASPYGYDGRQHDGPVYPGLPALEIESDHIEIARQVIEKYRQEVDILVMVSHLGLNTDIRIAEQTSGIDLILGGHSHTTMDGPLRVNSSDIIHTGSHAGHIGRYDLVYDVNRKSITTRSFQLIANRPESIPADADVDLKIATILKPFLKQLKDAVVELKDDQQRPAMALLAARAAVEKLEVDAAFVSEGSVWSEWRRGELTLQDIYSAFLVEREPVGTPGRTSMYVVKVRGADLFHVRAVLTDSAYCGPAEIDPDVLYTVAMQKPQAFGQQEFFAWNISASAPRPGAELWEIVAAYAGEMKARNLALDEEVDGKQADNLLAYLPGDGKKDSLL